jgi:hypothetical protein
MCRLSRKTGILPGLFPIERLTPLEAETLWNTYAGGLLKEEDPSVLSARYRMTPGQIGMPYALPVLRTRTGLWR